MDFDLSPEHELLRKTIRDYLSREVVDKVEEHEEVAGRPAPAPTPRSPAERPSRIRKIRRKRKRRLKVVALAAIALASFGEDIGAVEGMQRGRQSPGFQGGVFSPVLDQPTHFFHQWVARRVRGNVEAA